MTSKIKQPISLKDNIHTILYGSKDEKEKLKGQYFHIADTPEFMKEKGLIGEFFSVRYGIISRHKNKDEDHNLSGQNWVDICKKITDPFAIIKNGCTYRLFTDVKINNRNIVVCVGVKNIGKALDVNAVTTAFGYRDRLITGEILYRSKKNNP